MELLAKDGGQVQVGDDQVFLELPGAGDDLAALVEDHAAAVKDEFVLPADQVAESDENDVIGGAGGQHALARGALAGMVGRGRDVDHHLRPGQGLRLGRPGGVPDVLADVDPDHRLAQAKDQRALPGAKVAVLVKDAVVGQVGLVVGSRHPPVVQHGGGVVDVVCAVDEPDDRRNGRRALPGADALRRARSLCDPLQRLHVVLHKAGLEQQVLGRVAGHGHLGKGDQVGAQRAGAGDAVDDFALVAGQVPDGGVDLGQGEAKGGHRVASVEGVIRVVCCVFRVAYSVFCSGRAAQLRRQLRQSDRPPRGGSYYSRTLAKSSF